MMFMVIEAFKAGSTTEIGVRFKEKGRMLPEGVVYHSSWIDPATERCFQLMEAPRAEALNPWINRWHDLMEFQVVPVLSSSEFWAKVGNVR